MDQEEDIHVLTGALKLFFRELREPLIPFNFFDKFIKAIRECLSLEYFVVSCWGVFTLEHWDNRVAVLKNVDLSFVEMQDKTQKLKLIKELIKLLPRVNYDTMKELFAHLTRYRTLFYMFYSLANFTSLP